MSQDVIRLRAALYPAPSRSLASSCVHQFFGVSSSGAGCSFFPQPLPLLCHLHVFQINFVAEKKNEMSLNTKRVLQESNSISSGSNDGICGNTAFSSASLFERVQKNVAGKLGKRSVMKHFVSGNSARLFDNLYTILKERYPKNTAEKVISNIIKLSLKIGVVTRENKLSDRLLDDLSLFQKNLKSLLLTVISFVMLDYSYDYKHLKRLMDEMQVLLANLTGELLSEKSQKRVSHIFTHLSDAEFLDSTFRAGSAHHELMKAMCTDLETMLENKTL